MRKLSKEKKQHLILTALVTLTALAGLWYGLIRAQQRSLNGIADRTAKAEQELAQVKSTIARADEIEAGLKEGSVILDELERNMANGDIYAWLITRIREFKNDYAVDIPQFSQIEGPKAADMLPDFPYQQAGITIAGTGNFNDIGTFIADFENRHPFSRICNVILEPANNIPGGGREKLTFRMDVVTLVRSPGA